MNVSEILEMLGRGDNDADLTDVLSRLFNKTKSFEADPCALCPNYNKGVTCTEHLAIYCLKDDMIYYNTDRIASWLTRLYLANMGTFMKQLANAMKNELKGGGGSFKLGVPIGLVKELAAKATVDVAMTYLVSHERYHWAHGPNASSANEEAMATAYGMYNAFNTAYGPSMELITPIKDLVMIYVMPDHLHVHPESPSTISYILELYFRHLTLARLAYEHSLLKGYSGFFAYLDPIPKTPKIMIDNLGRVSVSLEFFSRGKYEQVSYVRHGIVDIEIKNLFTPQFTGQRRSRNDELRERSKHCESCIELEPNPWWVSINSIVNDQYLVMRSQWSHPKG
ncbi:hypothetical protein [Acidilobus sp.]|uniref:hypothetical protein n=1 Tax=Acidilobus sp. TaxID=1872109 RepID=UPI003D07827B